MIKYLAGKLWFYKIEGMDTFNGINVYRKNDENNAGFVLRLGQLIFKCRYSKRINKWFLGFRWHKPTYMEYKN